MTIERGHLDNELENLNKDIDLIMQRQAVFTPLAKSYLSILGSSLSCRLVLSIATRSFVIPGRTILIRFSS